jgi:hypothetical protein
VFNIVEIEEEDVILVVVDSDDVVRVLTEVFDAVVEEFIVLVV